MKRRSYDIVIIGSGAGGGTVAAELSSLCRDGVRIAVLEKGPKLRDEEFTGREVEMATALYEDGGGFLTAEQTMTLAFGSAYGGSTVVYTGTSLLPPERVLERWNVPGLSFADVEQRARKYVAENNVHLLEESLLNQNNRLFVEGCRELGYRVQQFPVNLKGCRGSSLCNLGCPNQAKQGTNRVQLPRAEQNGVEVVTRCEVRRIEVLNKKDRKIFVSVSEKLEGSKGEPSTWEPGDYEIDAKVVVVCGGAVNSPALLLRSGFGRSLPRLGHGFTCHPAFIMVAEHSRPITNAVGHPKSFYLDQFAESDHFLLETCMYFPFVTAKAMVGFGEEHSRFMRAFPRLQMILVLACDEVNDHNRITIDADGRPVVHYRFTPEVIRGLVQGAITSAKISFAAGAVRAHVPVSHSPTIERANRERLDDIAKDPDFKLGKLCISSAHLQGGCAMGSGPDDSVTDSYGRVHGVPGLYVADSSLFPNSLEINPYLTIMALADRVAESVRSDVKHFHEHDISCRPSGIDGTNLRKDVVMARSTSKGKPHVNLWPPSTWFSKGEWKRDMTPEEAARVIERFLDGPSDSIEWCDFAETRQEDPRVEGYRKRCDELSPLVNRPGGMDEAAVAELRSIIEELRSIGR